MQIDSTIYALAAALQEGGGGGGGQGGAAPPGCGGGIQPIIFMGLMFLVFYFILIRPQQKRAKEHQAMISNLSKGDQVVTRGGLVGKVSGVQDKYVILELQEKVRVRVVKSYIDTKTDALAQTGSAKSNKEARAS